MTTNLKELKCNNCGKTFLKRVSIKSVKNSKSNIFYCSHKCFTDYKYKTANFSNCHICGNIIQKRPSTIKRSKSGFVFCSRKCSNKHNNKFKCRANRSKIETAFSKKLELLFPNLVFLYNKKDIVPGYELDIYIESLNLAIEWNGAVHYFPIYGEEKLKQIQYRDYKKQLLCQKHGIDLVVICDLTSRGNIIEESIEKVSNIIKNKINIKNN
jgi:hypothetical protein